MKGSLQKIKCGRHHAYAFRRQSMTVEGDPAIINGGNMVCRTSVMLPAVEI